MTLAPPDVQHNQRHGDEDHSRVVVIGGVTPTTIAPDDAAAAGSSTTGASADHKHAIVAATAGAIQPDDAAAEGSATSFARSDHKHSIVADVAGAIQPDDTAAEGTATSFARSDHKHSIVAASVGASYPSDTAAEGSATSFARSDHTHFREEIKAASTNGAETRANVAYGDLSGGATGPAVSIATRTNVLVHFACNLSNSGANYSNVSFAISGSTTVAAQDIYAIVHNGTVEEGQGRSVLITGLTAGSNTFTMKYKTSAGTGTFANRHIIVEVL